MKKMVFVAFVLLILLSGCIDLKSKNEKFCDGLKPALKKSFIVEFENRKSTAPDQLENLISTAEDQEELEIFRVCTFERTNEIDVMEITYSRYSSGYGHLIEKRLNEFAFNGISKNPNNYTYIEHMDGDLFFLYNENSIVTIEHYTKDNKTISKSSMENVARKAMELGKNE